MNRILVFLLFTCLLSACSGEDVAPITDTIPENTNRWSIPQNEVFDGGPGKDGIPSVDRPHFAKASNTANLDMDELVLGIIHKDMARAYPHSILDWHEIVNDDLDDLSIAVTYCPLTGTGVGWDRMIQGNKTEFGVSGLLFESNLMPYDRNTNSTWSQQRLDCVNGDLVGTDINAIVMIETTMGTWLEAYPESDLMTEETGFNRAYDRYPYGDYRTNNDRLLFPVSNDDSRLNKKDRVLGVLGESASIAYPFNYEMTDTEILYDYLEGDEIIIIRNTNLNYIVSYHNPNGLRFTIVEDGLPAIIQDEDGNEYDLAGRGLETSRTVPDLVPTLSFMGYWFSWGTFYPDIQLYGE